MFRRCRPVPVRLGWLFVAVGIMLGGVHAALANPDSASHKRVWIKGHVLPSTPVAEPPMWTSNWYRPFYLRSDDPANGVTQPGVPVAGLDHDGVGRVLIERTDLGGFVACTGSLLWSGRHVLTAAHCLVNESGIPSAGAVTVTWQTPAGTVTADAQCVIYPELGGQIRYNGNVLDGWDIAVIELDRYISAATVTRYDIFRDSGLSELDVTTVKVGYGQSGLGSDGITLPSGTKRFGLNEWDWIGLGSLNVNGITNNDTQLTYDFDSGLLGNDAFRVFFGFAPDTGLGNDEAGGAPGDSGGPSFIDIDGQFLIAGVTSYGLRLSDRQFGTPPNSDVDDVLNSSWGEFGGDARVAFPGIVDFIDGVVPDTSVDLVVDGLVNLLDYAVLADRWQDSCSAPDYCGGADINQDGTVDVDDRALLVDAWSF